MYIYIYMMKASLLLWPYGPQISQTTCIWESIRVMGDGWILGSLIARLTILCANTA